MRRASRIFAAGLLLAGLLYLGHGYYIPAKAWLAQELLEDSWEKTVETGDRYPPWPWADTWPVAKLTARDGEVELIVLAGSSGRTLAFGPGHMSASVLPGETGNSVIAGHRDTHFRFLENVAVEDDLEIEDADGRRHAYRVSHIEVVDSNYGAIRLGSETPVLTLVTCYPFDAPTAGGPLRYVVTADSVETAGRDATRHAVSDSF